MNSTKICFQQTRKERKMYNAIWSIPTLSLPLIDFFKIFGISAVCAVMVSLTYIIVRRQTGYRPSVVSTIMMLAPAVCLIMLVVGDSAARAISIGGGIAFIRYRSTLEDPRDLTHILIALASGIACRSTPLRSSAQFRSLSLLSISAE